MLQLTFIFTIALCVVIFITANFGIFIIAKTNSIKNLSWRSSFIYGLGLYWFLNYFRLIYLLPSFFIYTNNYYQAYVTYSQACYCTQNLLILVMSFGRMFISCRNQFAANSLAFTSMLYMFLILISAIYALALSEFEKWYILEIVGLLLILTNIISFVISLGVAVSSSCCVKNYEKRQQMNYAWISLFISLVFMVEYGIAIVTGLLQYRNGLRSLPALVTTVGMVSIVAEIILLLGSFLIFIILWSQQKPIKSIHPTPSNSVASTATTGSVPIGPLMVQQQQA